ncbi:MAG: nicotinamide riboside transporter PnuC [Pseudomonadota bacterium]
MTALEWIAAALGIACVVLLVRRSLWNYPFAIASVSLLGVVFWDAKLYSDALLQIFFVVINLYGWWDWSRSSSAAGEVVVERMPLFEQVGTLAGMIGLTLGWGAIMASQTDASFPFVDAAVAMLSIGAQIMLARRKLENWFVWIAVDLIAIPLYAAKGLHAAAALYVVYLGLSVWGLRDWHRAHRTAGPVVA